jgi:hypothetical protein
MSEQKREREKNRSGGPDHEATGHTGISDSENSGVSREDAAHRVDPGRGGAAAPDPTAPDR